MSDDIAVIKLSTGEQIIAQLINQTPDGIIVLRPITLKYVTVLVEGSMSERITTQLYCPVSDQESFVFDARHCIYVNRLHPRIIPHYKRLSEEMYSSLHRAVSLDELDSDEPEKEQEVHQDKPKNITYH